tara:strand:+ start:152 stop:715 length:564 start_codon:yes stop_codon:yes gene_type:complete
MNNKSISDMLQMQIVEPDATNVKLEPLDVFGEKSKDADDAVEYGMGLSPEELLDIAMSVTPMGRVKAGKGAISFLKGLLGMGKSPTKNIIKKKTSAFEDEMIDLLYDKSEASKASLLKNLRRDKTLDQQLFELKEQGKMLIENSKRASKIIGEDQKAIDEAIKRMKSSNKPKGMRQFGKFNRQKWDK